MSFHVMVIIPLLITFYKPPVPKHSCGWHLPRVSNPNTSILVADLIIECTSLLALLLEKARATYDLFKCIGGRLRGRQ